MYTHILIAIDDSATSLKALEEAILLAKQQNAKLEIIHAVDESILQTVTTHGEMLAPADQLQRSMANSGDAILEDARRMAEEAGISPLTKLLVSRDQHAADQITEAVEQSKPDLLVVGSHGRRGFKRLLLGSVAEDLVRKVSVSMLIVRGLDETAVEEQ